VHESSVIIGKLIGELDLVPRMGVDILAIFRDKDWIINPKENERILAGDVLIVRGAPEGLKEFKEICEARKAQLRD
jgi:uncharacterized protein with PhoU and TrkA domain